MSEELTCRAQEGAQPGWCWLGVFEEGAQLWDGRNRPWEVLVLGAATWRVGGSSPAASRIALLLQRTFPAARTKMKPPGKFFPVSWHLGLAAEGG